MLRSILPSKPFLIAGPCVLETEEICLEIAAKLKLIADEMGMPVIFKGSYTKANRTREHSFHGIGLEQGFELLKIVKQQYGIAVTSDVHEVAEVEKAAEILDIIQIPALLCKNTNLLHAAGDTGKPVNIKKGYFVTAQDMGLSIEKIQSRGNDSIMVTERGTLFGYGDMVVDFRSIGILKSFGYPVIFDATHSVRIISRRSDDREGGTPEAIPLLIRCAAVAGADGLFIEVHPHPQKALCDSVVSYPVEKLKLLVKTFKDLHSFATRSV